LSGKVPSNFVLFVLVFVAVVLVWLAWASVHHEHRSADQRILMEKAK